VEPVELGCQLQVDQASGQRRQVRGSFGAGPQVQVAQPLRDAGQPAVGVVHVLDRLVCPAVGVLGQHGHRVGVTRVAELLERVDDTVHVARPAGGLAVVDEVVVGGERHVDPPAPRAQLRSLTPGRTGRGRQTLPQPPVRLDLREHQLDQPLVGEAGHIPGEIALGRARHRPQMRGLDAVTRIARVSVEEQSDCHAVLAERAILGGRARARPGRLAVVGPQLDPIGHRTPHSGPYPKLAAGLRLHPAVLEVANPTGERTRPREVPDHRRGKALTQRRHGRPR
jgi:hypothetical protein